MRFLSEHYQMGLGNRLRMQIKAWYMRSCPIRPPAYLRGQRFSYTNFTVKQPVLAGPITWARRRMPIGRVPGSALSLSRAQSSDLIAWCEDGPRKHRGIKCFTCIGSTWTYSFLQSTSRNSYEPVMGRADFPLSAKLSVLTQTYGRVCVYPFRGTSLATRRVAS